MLLLVQQIKQIGLELLELVGKFLTLLVLLVAYCLIGCVFSAPYTFLAGGDNYNFFLGIAFMPIILFFLFVFWKTMRRGQHKWGKSTFWILVTYFCLPIILNGSSLLLKKVGYETIGDYVFAGRYFSLWAIPTFLVVCGIILIVITNLWQRFNKNNSAV